MKTTRTARGGCNVVALLFFALIYWVAPCVAHGQEYWSYGGESGSSYSFSPDYLGEVEVYVEIETV